MARTKTTSRSDQRPPAPEAPLIAERTCFECGGPMERGFVPDLTHGGATGGLWVEGIFQRSMWMAYKKKGRRQYHIVVFRCAQCGALRSYATEPK